MRGAPLPSIAVLCSMLLAGCYQSHELSPCTFVPVEERCTGYPSEVFPAHRLADAYGTLHWPTSGECISVFVSPELASARPAVQQAIDELNAIECSLLCLESPRVAPPERRSRAIEIVPKCDDCCDGCAGTSGWFASFALCRGDIDRATIWTGPSDRVDAAFFRRQLIGTMGINVPLTDAPLSLTPDVERSLCAMYGDPPYCGD